VKSGLDMEIDKFFGIKPDRPPMKAEEEIGELIELNKYMIMMYGTSKGDLDTVQIGGQKVNG